MSAVSSVDLTPVGTRRGLPDGGFQVMTIYGWRDGHSQEAKTVLASQGAVADAHIEAALSSEQALLGCLLYDSSRFPEAAHAVPEHFSEGLHARIFALISEDAKAGRQSDPTTINARLNADPSLAEMGGFRYLYDLVDKAPPASLAREFADAVVDAWSRRTIAGVCSSYAAAVFQESATLAYEHLGSLRAALDSVEKAGGPALADLATATEAADALMDELDAEAESGSPAGLKVGLRCIDRRLKGLRPGWVVVVGGRPGMGKTTLARSIGYGAARWNPDATVVFFALEMSRRELTERALSEASHLSGDGIAYEAMAETLSWEQRKRLRALRDRLPANLIIDDRSTLSVDSVRRRIWALKQRGKNVRAVVIDYLQLMQRPAAKGRNEASVIGEMTSELKRIASETGCCIVLVSQLSRQVEGREDKRPQLSDLRESGSIEQDANAVLFPFREHYYLQKAEPAAKGPERQAWEERCELAFRKLDVHAAKVRQGREGTDRQVVWIEYDHITDPAPEYEGDGHR